MKSSPARCLLGTGHPSVDGIAKMPYASPPHETKGDLAPFPSPLKMLIGGDVHGIGDGNEQRDNAALWRVLSMYQNSTLNSN